MSSITDIPITSLRTQKAQGVHTLARFADRAADLPGGFSTEVCRQTLLYPHQFLDVQEMVKKAVWEGRSVFARPCPVTPRHGFVDSKKTGELPHIESMYNLMKKIDPLGELLIAPYVRATVSGVITPNRLTLGVGGAGVTGGVSCIVDMPFHVGWAAGIQGMSKGPLSVSIQPYLLSCEGSTQPQPYVEFVSDFKTANPQIVQVRFGPTTPTTSSYIPEDCIVAEKLPWMYILEQNFTAWEEAVKEAAKKNAERKKEGSLERTVFCLPGPSTLASHWAVQAILHGIPVLAQVVPTGTTLTSNNGEGGMSAPSAALTERVARHLRDCRDSAPQAIINSYILTPPEAFLHDAPAYMGAVGKATLLAAHHGLGWGSSDETARYIARAVVAYVHLGAMCCLGEVRHYAKQCGAKVTRKRKAKLLYAAPFWLPQAALRGPALSRNAVYTHCLFLGWRTLRKELKAAKADLRADGWTNSYGGQRWADCTQHLLNMMDCIDEGVKAPGAWSLSNLMTHWHASINATHNGNVPMLTKCVKKADLDHAAGEPHRLINDQHTLRAIAALGGHYCDY